MLDKFDRARGTTSYWSALINPALMNFNDFNNFYLYHRNLMAMHIHQQHQEMFRQHFGQNFNKKRRNESESPKPKRQKIENSIGASVMNFENAEELRAETTTPNSDRLITFRPHSDILTSSFEVNSSKIPQHRRITDNQGPCKRDASTSMSTNHTMSKNKLSTLLSTRSDYSVEGPISKLFPEILSMIFEYLDVTSKGRAAQVCTVWREAAYRKSVWRGVEAKLHLKRSNPTLFVSLTKRGINHVQVLSLKKSLRDLIHGMPNLECLNLSGCYNVSESAIDTAFTRALPKLKHLNVSLCKEISDNSLGRIATNCKNLEVLDLGGCSKVTNNGMLLVAWGLRHLKKLNLRSCRQITDHGIANLCGSNDSARLSEGAKTLVDLCLQDCQKLTDRSLKYLSAGLPKLEKLNLSFCVSITDTGLKSLAKCPNLEDLNLCSCDNVSDIGIGFLARPQDSACEQDVPNACLNLQSLDVSFCSNITDTGMKQIAAGLTQLKSLSIANSSLTDESLTRIAKSLAHLDKLNIAQCNKISDVGILDVAANLKSLTQIDLYGCSKVTSGAICQLKKLPKMTKINQNLWPD